MNKWHVIDICIEASQTLVSYVAPLLFVVALLAAVAVVASLMIFPRHPLASLVGAFSGAGMLVLAGDAFGDTQTSILDCLP